MLPSPPQLSHQRVFPTGNFNLKGLKSRGQEGFVERGRVQPRAEPRLEREALFAGAGLIFSLLVGPSNDPHPPVTHQGAYDAAMKK